MRRPQISMEAARRATKRARRESRKNTPRPARPPWTGSLELLALPRGVCPDCTRTLTFSALGDQPALVFLHGHGYVVRVTRVSCVCGYRRHVSTTAHNPRR